MADIPTTATVGGAPRISVVIVHTSRPDLLTGCLQTLAEASVRGALEVVVVDNASGTPDLPAVAEAALPGTRVVPAPERCGLPRASNLGFRAARGDLVFWLNDDTLVTADAIERLADFLDAHPTYGIAAPRLLNTDGSYQGSFTNRDLSPLREVAEQVGLRHLWPGGDMARSRHERPLEEQDARIVSGICMIRTSALRQIGLLDERVFLYTEEFDLCRRMRQAGWKIRYLPAATVVHFGGGTTGSPLATPRARQFGLQMILSRLSYYRRHYGPVGEVVGSAAVCAGAAVRLVVYGTRARLGGDARSATVAAFYRDVLRYGTGARPRRADALPQLG